MRPDEVVARHRLRGLRAAGRERRVAVVAAEGQVEREAHVLEVVRAADPRLEAEVGEGLAPGAGLRALHRDVRGLQAIRPEPGADVPGLGVPLGGVGAAALRVEARAHGVLRPALRAALVVPLVVRIDVAIVGRLAGRPQLPDAGEVLPGRDLVLVAVRGGVEGGHRAVGHVNALDDVVLAPARPNVLGVLPEHPHGGPRAAARGDVVQRGDEEAPVEHLLRLDPHGAAAGLGSGAREVRAHVDVVGRSARQAVRLGGLLIYVLDEALRRVGGGPEVPLGEEVLPHKRLLVPVGRQRRGSGGAAAEQDGELPHLHGNPPGAAEAVAERAG
mmetsp:Transcript_6703/g.17092  ORF Transcript_6703/g.17092 Transcript_6703/m.17092 type:complete len:330 (+) Transcript_6703:1552-2541(+)